MPRTEKVMLWEVVVSLGGKNAPADTVGYYTEEHTAQACTDLNKMQPGVFAEYHVVHALKLEGEYFIGTRQIKVNEPIRKLTPRKEYSLRRIR